MNLFNRADFFYPDFVLILFIIDTLMFPDRVINTVIAGLTAYSS